MDLEDFFKRAQTDSEDAIRPWSADKHPDRKIIIELLNTARRTASLNDFFKRLDLRKKRVIKMLIL